MADINVTFDTPSIDVELTGGFTIDTTARTASTEALEAATTAETNAADALTAATTAETNSENALANLADTYDSTATYEVGEYCLYDSVLYVCSTAVETAGDFDSDYWTQVTVGEELTDIGSRALAAYIQNTASGSIASFTDGVGNVPAVDLTIDIDYSADGWTAANVTRCGKNFVPYPYNFTTKTNKGVTLTVNSDGSITASGTATGSAYFALTSFDIASGTYTLSGCPSGGGSSVYQLYTTGASSSWYDTGSGDTKTLTADGTITLAFIVYSGTTIDATIYPMLELDSSATDYEAYSATTLNIDWSSEVGTIYGGSLDVTTGVLTSTYDSDGTELETAVEYELTTQEITTLSGTNHIWSDTGDTTVTYYADTQTYIDKAISESNAIIADEYDSTATYSVGDYCIYDGDFYICSTAVETAGDFDSDYWTAVTVAEKLIELAEFEDLTDNFIPTLRNGSVPNSGNSTGISTANVLGFDSYDAIRIKFIGDYDEGDYLYFEAYGFNDSAAGMTSTAAVIAGYCEYTSSPIQWSTRDYVDITSADVGRCNYFAVTVWRGDSTTYNSIPLRIADVGNALRVERFNYLTERELPTYELETARHVRANAGTSLTVLHFSDIHGDSEAFNRIVSDAEKLSVDDIICTGDMQANVSTSSTLSDWWDSSVLTCIGNHDCATYNSSTGYDWVALSMADRDTNYIAPFEDSWDITHTSGTSYYYKDYSDAAVRLIVMDVMLYEDDDDTTEADTQTSWLESLLEDAITNSLHVLIAIHCPHGGATAVDCSFSRYGQSTMPTYGDCNTPQTVIDTVASAITSGLNFIGYIVGHTHQDNIWDAEGDNTQLMYCVACANTANEDNWKNSDQDRSNNVDAYNLVTIDTTNTLVKIVRGGGANIDDHMRTRKAICIDYSTGTVIGEVL